MSVTPKMVTAVVGSALTAVAFQVGGAQAATHTAPPGSHPGLGKAVVPDASCGSTITWQDRYDNKYLEIYHSGTAAGNWADAFAGNGSCTQHWFAVASGYYDDEGSNRNEYGMVNANSDLCLAAPTTDVGNSHVVQEACGFSKYNYRWLELSNGNAGGGYDLIEVTAPGYTKPAGDPFSAGIIACEDKVNHYIYTSYGYNPNTGVDNNTAKNCIWH